MEQHCLDLIEALDKENQILEKLAVLACEKKEHVILGKVKELENLIREEGIIISELGKWEDARFRIQQQLGEESPAAVPMKAGRLVGLVRESCPHLATGLQEALNRLEINLQRLNQLNRHNNELLEQSLDHIAFLEAALVGNHSGAYSQKGSQSAGSPSRINLLDRKV
jgi:flagellar biosynthesis/type III secretory pathway chaperone